jgi:hypothetical protein
MAATFNAIPFLALAAFLKSLGFVETTIQTKDGHEVVYERRNARDDHFIVLIYTSCSPDGKSVRKKGADAIRVCLVAESERVKSVQEYYKNANPTGRIGLGKAKRVNRAGTTESIFCRIRDRARDMYKLSNQMIKSERCTCGAPTYPDTGKCILRGYCIDKKKAVA